MEESKNHRCLVDLDLIPFKLIRYYHLYEAYNPSFVRGGQLNLTKIGTWSLRDGYNLIVNKTKFENRRNFQGITFKGVVTVNDFMW